MKKIILLICLFCPVFSAIAQEKVFEIENAFEKPKSKKNKSFALQNQKTGGLMLITLGKKTAQGILLDSLYQKKSTIIAESLPSKFKYFLGYSIKDDIYAILFSNEKQSKFGVLQFNIKDNTYAEKILDFKFKKETFVDSMVYDNEMYLFTFTTRSSELNIYKFDANFNPKKYAFSFHQMEYPKIPGSSIKLRAYSLFRGIPNSPNTPTIGAVKIETNNPNIIETTSSKIKIYQEDQNVIFSFDNNPEKTDLFFINLKSLELTYKSYEKVSIDRDNYEKNNSYLFDNKLFQIASSKSLMNFRITNIENDKIIKEYSINKEDSISFKNSPILQEKFGQGTFGRQIDKVKEIEKTDKFLKKISIANLGISVYKVNNLYNVVLGGTQNYDPNAGLNIAFAVLGGVGGATGAITFIPDDPIFTNFNPTYYNYNAYNATKSTYINCLFDENFEHIQGNIPLNSFDHLYDFENTLDNPYAINIFLHNNRLHYGFFDVKKRSYTLYRFKE